MRRLFEACVCRRQGQQPFRKDAALTFSKARGDQSLAGTCALKSIVLVLNRTFLQFSI